MFRVSLKKFDAKWATEFQKEAQKIAKILDEGIESIIHIGSTSIEDMTANEIIDIAICVDSPEYLKQCTRALANLRYRDIGYFDQKNWLILGRDDEKFHLHLGPYDGEEIINLLLFRLYLSKHADYREFYVDLKKKLIEESEESLYEVNKQPFVTRVVMLAKLEYLNGGVAESDFDILYKNAIVSNRDKMTGAIKGICQADEEKLSDKIPHYNELHSTMMDEAEKATRESPFYCQFSITTRDGEPVEMSEKTEKYLKTMFSETMLRRCLRTEEPDTD